MNAQPIERWILRIVNVTSDINMPVFKWELFRGDEKIALIKLSPAPCDTIPIATDIKKSYTFYEPDINEMIQRMMRDYRWGEPPLLLAAYLKLKETLNESLSDDYEHIFRIVRDRWELLLAHYQESQFFFMKVRGSWEEKLADIFPDGINLEGR